MEDLRDGSDRVTLSHEELSLLLGGIDLTRTRRKNWYRKSEIARRFIWLEQRFGLLKVDIVAAIVTRYLPASPFVVPPKRRPRRKRF